MNQFDVSNTNFRKAVSFVNQTSRHLFVTGKAGTGKTTFLKYIRDNCFKKSAIVAPTGVAAINAGGVTIHSFFQLPMGIYLPTRQSHWETYDGKINNQHSLLKNLRLNASKRELLQELELLVIDEVSMVRADTLDAIDAVLRHARRQPLHPFGGVQVLYIGDLFQLPPVARQEEWDLLQKFYKSPFFFDALALQQSPPVYIELKKIYRQSDEVFINILNNIRNNTCRPDDLEYLHQYYKPSFAPSADENFITLTSHNDKADAINRAELQKLPGKEWKLKATIKGEFADRAFPAEEELLLKTGAQIMFLKNDKGEFRRFYNGKIGLIDSIEEDKIMVSFPGEPDLMELVTETWQNIRYKYNKEKDTLEEEELGTFTQYPIRLAWAITIHKSQGLTFSKAIIDAGASFAPGQVYVALSRLTGLDGLVLRSRINPDSIRTDERVLQFVESELPDNVLEETLEQEQHTFIQESLLKKFNWVKITEALRSNMQGYMERQIPEIQECISWASGILQTATRQEEVAAKFLRQLERLLAESELKGFSVVHERTEAAVQYFVKEVREGLIASVEKHMSDMQGRDRTKKYMKELAELKRMFERHVHHLNQAAGLTKAMRDNAEMSTLLELAEAMQKPVEISLSVEDVEEKKARRQKGDSHRASLQMFREGKSINDIVRERNLSLTTIETHLASFIITGEVHVTELVSQEKLDKILSMVEKEPNISSWTIKQALGDDVSWGDIRAALNYRDKMAKEGISNME